MIGDIKEVLGVVGRIRGAIQGADDIKTKIRAQMHDYESVLQVMRVECPGAMFSHELENLVELFNNIEQLHKEHTAGPEDGRAARIARIVNRGAMHTTIEEALKDIDWQVFRQFKAVAAKSATIKRTVLDVRPELRRNFRTQLSFTTMLGAVLLAVAAVMFDMVSVLRPPNLPEMAAVPREAIALTDAHISRPLLLGSAIGYLTNTKLGDAPCVLAGMAGSGKSLLASAVVRNGEVREHFRAGMFWWRVGRGAKDQLHGWLEGLALRVASTSGTKLPRLDSLEDVTRYLKAQCVDAVSPRLVVLDDVWEREIVDALKLTGLQLLVTTRDRSVVSMPGESVEVGNMENHEALEVLKVGCGAHKSIELPRPEALQVTVILAGRLELYHAHMFAFLSSKQQHGSFRLIGTRTPCSLNGRSQAVIIQLRTSPPLRPRSLMTAGGSHSRLASPRRY